MSSSFPSYPDELKIKGRTPDPDFASDEPLYRRIREIDPRGRVSNVDLRFPDTSLNRGKHSKPEWVLFSEIPKYLKWGIAELRVDEIPQGAKSGDQRAFSIRVEHDPVLKPEENYSHCEIRAYLESVRQKKVPAKIEKEIKQILSDRMKIIKNPNLETSDAK